MAISATKLGLGQEQIALQAVRSSLQMYISTGDTHSLCVVCLRVERSESALEGGFWGIFSLNVYALGGFLKLSEHSPAFLAVSVLFLPMQSVGCARGNRRWIRWRERRRAIPYLLPFPSDPAPAHWVQKPAPRFLTTGERA